jgi:hypothetical protein
MELKMGKQKTAQNSWPIVIETIKDFITIISKNLDELSARSNPAIFFSTADEGVLFLNIDEAKQYKKCHQMLIDLPSTEKMSVKAIESLFQKSILMSLDINNNRSDKSFEERLENSIKELESALKAKPHKYCVYFPIEGLLPDNLPLEYGEANFCILTKEKSSTLIKSSLSQNLSPEDHEKSIVYFEEMMQENLVNEPIVMTTVLANDNEAAKNYALIKIRLTLDVMNFFSDIIPYSKGFLFLPGDRNRKPTSILIISKEEKPTLTIANQVVGPLTPLSAEMFRNAEKKYKNGFSQAGQLLIACKGGFQSKLLSAIHWAGRATIEDRKEEAFLLYAIALESLVLAENQKDELGYRLSIRVAHLLGDNVQHREDITKRIKELYEIRSKIVHSGFYQVTDADLGDMRKITKGCILRILKDKELFEIKSTVEFIKWFENRILN